MPPSSRKRNKGKDRKAKQLAKKEENERADSHDFWWSFCRSTTECNHGCAMISENHPVSTFMDQFYINLHQGMTVLETLIDLFEKHPQVWNNERYRKLAIDTLVRIGTNMILSNYPHITNPLCVAQSIMVLEHFDDADDINLVLDKRVVASKWNDLWLGDGSGRRDALKFYRKRTTCKCLKKRHLEARKKEPKMGMCHHCKVEMERVSLSVCRRCIVGQYCSRKCQVAQWPAHESKCNLYVQAHKQHSSECQDERQNNVENMVSEAPG